MPHGLGHASRRVYSTVRTRLGACSNEIMDTTTAKEKILNRIREALINPVPLPFPQSEGDQSVYHAPGEDLVVLFAKEFTKLQGNFSFCTGKEELGTQLTQLFAERDWNKIYCAETELQEMLNTISVSNFEDLPSCDAAVTGCEFLVSRTGSIVLSSASAKGRTAGVYAPIHICIAYTDQVVYDINDALKSVKEKYGASFPSFVTFASGPSRTADIEKTLVTGVHGPKEVYCFLTDRQK